MLLLIGFLLLLAAALLDLPRWPGRTAQLAWLACTASAVVFTVAGARGITGHSSTLNLGTLGGLGPSRLTVDRLSGLFLVLCFAIAALVLVAGTGLIASMVRPRLAGSVALCLASVALILTAGQVFVFLFGWEGLTLAFYLLSGHDRRLPGRGRASMLAGGFGKVSGALLMLGFLLLAGHAHSLDFATIMRFHSGASSDAGYVLLLLGFGVKVGWIPLQIWLPPAYAAAPGPARPVMAAVAVNVGFYGMWRTLQLLGVPPTWLVVMVLLIAGSTAILGIAHAAVHADLAYLVAWSSVENAGVITAGFGAAMVGSAAHNEKLVAVGLLAGFLQATAHAFGKATLFVATASAEQALGTTDLDQLRGVARRLPWTGTALVIGSLTLAGLPLTAGFTSEWFTLESLMQQFRIDGTSMKLATAFAGALVALTVGVAGVTFVRLVALTAFGHPAAPPAVLHRPERRLLLKIGLAALCVSCVGLSVIAPLEVRLIGSGLSSLSGDAGIGARSSPWVLQPVFADFSALSPSWMAIVLPAMFVIVAGFTLIVSRGGMLRVRSVPAWTSASPGVGRQTQYTSFGYANPMRKVLANVLRTQSQIHSIGDPAALGRAGTTPDAVDAVDGRRETDSSVITGAPGESAGDEVTNPELGYQVDVVEVVERYIYLPIATALFAVVAQAKRLQSGRLDAYMAYMLIAVIAVVAVVAGTV